MKKEIIILEGRLVQDYETIAVGDENLTHLLKDLAFNKPYVRIHIETGVEPKDE